MNLRRLAFLLLPGSLLACPPPPPEPFFTGADATTIQGLSPLPDLPPDPTNKYADNADAAALGQKLFFDKSFSGAIIAPTGSAPVATPLGSAGQKCRVACVDCHGHDETGAFPADGSGAAMDDRKTGGATDGTGHNNVALGTGDHPHNAPAVVNSAYYEWVNWNGRFKRIWELPGPVMENPQIMNGTRLQMGYVMFQKYKSDYEAVFGPLPSCFDASCTGAACACDNAAPWPSKGKPSTTPGCAGGSKTVGTDGTTACSAFDKLSAADQKQINVVFANYGKALHAYIRKLVSKTSKFDSYVKSGFTSADLTAGAQQGLKVFIGSAACTACHNTPLFSDAASTAFNAATPAAGTAFMFHATGVNQVTDGPTISGNTNPPQPTNDFGRFGTSNQAALVPKSPATGMFAPGFVTVGGGASDDATTGAMLLQPVLDAVNNVDGTGGPSGETAWTGTYRTPSLRNVALTSPYFHGGQKKSLLDVMKFYNTGGDGMGFTGTIDPAMKALNLSDQQLSNLVEFMNALTMDPVDSSLQNDTSAAIATPASVTNTYCQ